MISVNMAASETKLVFSLVARLADKLSSHTAGTIGTSGSTGTGSSVGSTSASSSSNVGGTGGGGSGGSSGSGIGNSAELEDPLVKQIVQSLVALSEQRLSLVAGGLASLLETISKTTSLVDAQPGGALERSQLFVMQALGRCMDHHWDCYRKNVDLPRAVPVGPSPSPAPGDSSAGTGSTDQQAMIRPLSDPPALDESLVKQLLALCVRFLQANNGDVANDLHKAAGQVLFYISASNFLIFFARIKTRIQALSVATDENADMFDLYLLEHFNLNSRRLSETLQELSSSCRSFKRTVLINLAVILRKVIWNWIHWHPMEFVSLCQSQRRLAGGPDILFDIFDALADNHKKKLVFWPVQTMLLILCPDILVNITVREGNSAVTSAKSNFLSNLKKSLNTKNLADVAAISYVDICKASTYVSKNDKMSALRHLVPEIENELKDRLFDPQHPFINQDGVVDQQLMIDCLMASFRLNARNVIWSLFPICLQEDSPVIFKLVLVKSCLQIASEENRLPWNPTISATYTNLATPLRKLFLDFLGSKRVIDTKTKGSSLSLSILGSKKKDIADDEAKTEFDIQVNILSLYIVDPTLALFSTDVKTQREDNRQLIFGLTLCLQDNNLRSKAALALLNLHQPGMIAQWGPPDELMQSFWEISSQVTLSIAKQIVDREEESTIRFLLGLLSDIFRFRVEFLRAHADIVAIGASTSDLNRSSTMLEIVLLVLLCSQDSDIATMVSRCLSALCTEAELLGYADYAHAFADNLVGYNELSTIGTSMTGRQMQQKRIRRLLRHIDHPSPGNIGAWEEAYRRWTPLIATFAKATSETTTTESKESRSGTLFQKSDKKEKSRDASIPAVDDKDKTEWQNFTGFLCALGGVCLSSSTDVSGKSLSGGGGVGGVGDFSTNSIKAPISSSDGPGTIRGYLSPPSATQQAVFRFVEELLDWLVCDSVAVREIVKESLGMEISQALYPMLFASIRARVDTFFDPKNEAEVLASDRATLFIEQTVVIIRFILDRLASFSEPLASVDLETLILLCARYLTRLGRSATSLRIKIKMVAMVEVLLTRRNFITFRQEIKFRNRLLEHFVEWTSDFATKTDTAVASMDEINQTQKFARDLDLACLKTIHMLLYQLPLQPMEVAAAADSDMNSLTEARAMLFYKYFSFMTKLLNRCRTLDSLERGTHSGKLTKDLQDLLNRSKDALKDLGPLRDFTILAMSNMLSANVDSGLKYSLGMGYHEDSKTRTAFMQVLTNILNQGTEFGELADDAIQDRYDRLVDLLVQPEHYIATALCDAVSVTDIDDLAPLLITIFDSRLDTMSLVCDLVDREVANTIDAPTLFRRNSLSTKVLTLYLKQAGNEYLTNTLNPAFNSLRAVNLGDNDTFEVDPSRIKPTENAAANMSRLLAVTKTFLDAIVSSTTKMPKMFQNVFNHTKKAVERKFPDAGLTAIGGLIFLRFFCPAIVNPDGLGLVSDMSMKDPRRRGLVLITKGIQNLANGVDMWNKESFMGPLNEILRASLPSVEGFLRNISMEAGHSSSVPVTIGSPSSTVKNSVATAASQHLDENELVRLHFYLNENLDKIGKELAARRLPVSPSAAIADTSVDTESAAKKALDTLTQLLTQLGPVPDNVVKGKSIAQTKVSATNQLFLEFMQRNAKRNVEPMKSRRIFFEGNLSKERRPVFYYVARKYQVGQVDEELLIFYLLQCLRPTMGKPFDLVVDLTQFTADNEVQNQWVTQFLQILPLEASENVTNILLYNANTAFKKYAKRMTRFFTAKMLKKMIFLSSLSDFGEYIAANDLQLPKSSVSLETDVTTNGATFSPVLKLSLFLAHVPVVVKVGTETMHVTSLKKHEIFGLPATINDIYHVSEIEEVTSTSKSTESEFTIKFERGTSSLSFSSPKAADISRALQTAKARFQLSKPSNVTARMIRPKDVPGTLLNMGLLNMGSDDPALRQAAYNLLYSLSITFNFDAGNQLLEAKGLCIPANNTSFVISIANKLSATEPHLTLEFLSEGLVGFRKSTMELKHLALEYMAPWLGNLALFCSPSVASDGPEKLQKTVEIIQQLIEITVEEAEMYPSLQSKVWHTIATVDEAVDLVLEAFIKFALQNQLGSRQAEVMADTAVTLASANVDLVAGKLIARLRRAIAQSAVKPAASLNQHPVWQEICILVRFALMLSFNNRLNVQQYLPELFYLASMVVATGPLLMRSSIHGLVVNILQSLCTSMPLSEDSLRSLTIMISQFSEPKYKLLFGISRGVAINAFLTQETNDDHSDKVSLLSLETIVSSLLDILGPAAVNFDIAAAWTARWMSLITATAFKPNPALQPRAFVSLGCLARHNRVNDELLVFQILLSLIDALNAFQEDDTELVVAIVMCLQRITVNMPNDSRFLRALFWIAVGLVQISHVDLFVVSVDFLEVVVRTLDSRGFFNEIPMAAFLMQSRQPLEGASKQLEALVGVQFTTNFSFAMAITLLRGLKHPLTKTATVRVLNTFLEISSSTKSAENKPVPTVDKRKEGLSQVLGFLAPLLPILEETELKNILWSTGILNANIADAFSSASTVLPNLFDLVIQLEPTTASLLSCLMVTMLQNAENEAESKFIYNFLNEIAVALPDVFMLVYESVLPKMTQVIGSSQSSKVFEAVQSIIYTVITTTKQSTDTKQARKTLVQHLHEIGFSGLPDSGSFLLVNKARKKQCATLVAQLTQSALK